MLAHEIPELGRDGSAAQNGDVMSDEILERGKLQPADVGCAHEEHPLFAQQRLGGKVAEARSLLVTQRGKEGVALTPKDQPQGTSPGKLLKGGFLAHGGEDVPEDFSAEARGLRVG